MSTWESLTKTLDIKAWESFHGWLCSMHIANHHCSQELMLSTTLWKEQNGMLNFWNLLPHVSLPLTDLYLCIFTEICCNHKHNCFQWVLWALLKNKTEGGIWNPQLAINGRSEGYFKSWKMMLWKCCTQYASKFGKLSSGHRTGKGQYSFQSQRKAMPKNAQILHNCTHLTHL